MDLKKSIQLGPTGYGHKATIIQIVLCIISNTALLSSGMTLGFTAIALPYMLQPNQILHVDTQQASWIASVAAMATPVGCLVSGPMIDLIGRRSGLVLLNLPALVGWLLIAVRPSLARVYAGRVLTGFALGLSSIPATVYITEGATSALRGLLATGTSIAISLGVALVYMMGLYLQDNWELVAGLCAVFPVISAVTILLLMPESPVWLMNKGKRDGAAASLMTLRGAESLDEVRLELDQMTERSRSFRNQSTSFLSAIRYLARPESYKPLLLMNVFFLFQQLTGIFVIIFYAVDVVQEAGVRTDPFVVAVFIGLTRLLITILAAWMSKRFGRRPCALISGVGMTVSLMLLATHLYNRGPDPEPLLASTSSYNTTGANLTENTPQEDNGDNASLLPLASVMVYILTSTIGFLTLPWTMIGEVYPSKIRGIAGGLTTCITYIVSFITVKVYPMMLQTLDKHGVFYFYGTMALLGTLFVAVFLPETQGKSLAEIEEYFSGKKKRINGKEEVEALHKSTKISIVSSGK